MILINDDILAIKDGILKTAGGTPDTRVEGDPDQVVGVAEAPKGLETGGAASSLLPH